MLSKKNQSTQVDINTLNLLPIAVAIFDNKKVYFINSRAVELFQISKKQLKNINTVSIFKFLDKQFHKRIKENNEKILNGQDFPPVELTFKTFKNKTIYIEAKSNCVLFEGKKLVQSTFIEISELKQKQFELEESEKLLIETKEKFDLITKSSNDIVAFYSYYPDEKYTYVSPNITKILGYKPKELLSDHNFFNKKVLGNKTDFLKIDTIVKNYQKKNIKKPYSYTFKTIKKNNEEAWLENNLTPITNKEGKIAFFLNIIRDITIQKEKELELNKQYLSYKTLLDSSPSAYIIHKQGVAVFCNKSMLKLLNVKKQSEVLGRFVLDFFAEQERKKALQRIKDIYNGVDINRPNNYVIKDTKGNYIDAELKSIVIKFNNENCILTLANNITEQKKIEGEKIKAETIKIKNEFLLQEVKERQITEKKLLEKTAHLSSIFESSDHLIWTVNKNFDITSYNKNFAKILFENFKVKAFPGINMNNINFIGKENYLKFWNNKYKIAFKGERIEFERGNTKKGQMVYRKVFINPIYNKNAVDEISCIAHDITETKNYENKLINQSAKLEAIFESGDQLIWTFNRDFELTSYNQNYIRLLKKDKQKQNKLYLKDTIINPKLISFWKKKFELVFKGEKQIFIHESVVNKKIVYREVFIHPIYFENKIIEASAIALDITERINNENKVRNQSAKLSAIFESGSQAMWTINKNREITSFNKNYENAVKELHSKKPILGKSLYSKEVGIKHSLDVYAQLWDKQYAVAFAGKSTEFVTERINKNNTLVIRQIYLQPIFNQQGEVEEVSGIGHDITEKKSSEQKLLNQAAKLSSIFDSSNHYIWTINNQQQLTSFNKNYFELVSSIYNTQPYVGFKLDRGVLDHDTEYGELLEYNYKKAFSGKSTSFDIEVLDKNYNKIYLEVFLNPVYNMDKIEEVSGIAHNVTEKIQSHLRVEQSLKEKDVLLKEVHHRVKNNMQIISSILNLQSSYVTDAYTLALLKESQNRIKTMAYIHESLYQNKSFTSVNFSEYIQTLSKNIIQSYVISADKIELLLTFDKISLNLDVSIPAGLIVNELITNAIKHAFPGTRKGYICLNLRIENNTVYLEVKDNGAGIPDGFDYTNTNTLGLQLVNTLIDQLDGQIIFNSKKDKGTEVLIKFKM